MQITLETKCWDADWRWILESRWLEILAINNCFDFAERVLMINNVKDPAPVCDAANKAIEQGRLTRYILVNDHADEALRFFQLTPEDLGKGYVYSIAELVSIYLCRTEYLLHFAGDCIPAARHDWIPKTLAFMKTDPRIKAANLTWNRRWEDAERECDFQTEDFYVGRGFSDQSYLIRTEDFRAPIYREHHPFSQRYPAYGGNLFEKRVDSWMRNHDYLRLTYKHAGYFHLDHVPPME